MPLFSILTPVFRPPISALQACIDSVLTQSEQDWEWCIVDDGSPDANVVELLNNLAASDSRVRLTRRQVNGGISAASQDALNLSSGEFVVLLDHDDMLAEHALERIREVLANDSHIDYLYTDEDKIDSDGNHYDEFLKPDWSPERLRGQNYCCHLSVLRRSLVEEVGGFRTGYEGSQDYDLILRVTEKARRIHHLPEVLYHWRAIPGSTASSIDEKPAAFVAAQRALQEHLDRSGINGRVEDAGFGYHRVVRSLKSQPLISIVIPTCGTRKVIGGVDVCLVTNTVDSIRRLSTYENYELVIVADSHTPRYVFDDLTGLGDSRLRIVPYDRPFNFSDKCNAGVVNSSGEFVLLLNDDVQVITPDWLEWLLGIALEADVGMVGPMLLFETGQIQSASHSNTPSPHNLGSGKYPHQPGDFGMLAISRECSGVTGAAAMIRREVYFEVGGLSIQFPNCFNDVDLAFKILEHGYRIIWTPHARLYHFESASRDSTVDKRELDLLLDRWGRFFDDDRFCRIN
jgi:O-antigen biosynthesis protein